MSYHLTIERAKRGIAGFPSKNFLYTVTLRSGNTISLKEFCERINLNYHSVHHRIRFRAKSQPDSSGFASIGTHTLPFQRMIADMKKRGQGVPPGYCPRCKGTGKLPTFPTTSTPEVIDHDDSSRNPDSSGENSRGG